MSENKHKEPLALSVVTAACGGDEDGEQYLFVDEELRRELETRLITKVLTFKPLAPKAA
jgi:hypothetical protein